MTRHIVARTTEIPPGGNKVVDVEGRDVVVFHVNGEFFALLNRCPHAGAPLDKAACVARLTSPEPGIYHAVNSGQATWYEFAREIIKRAGIKAAVIPLTSSEFPTVARRPAYSVLDNSKLSSIVGEIPHWTDALDRYLHKKEYIA